MIKNLIIFEDRDLMGAEIKLKLQGRGRNFEQFLCQAAPATASVPMKPCVCQILGTCCCHYFQNYFVL